MPTPESKMDHRKSREKVDADDLYFLHTYKGTVFQYNEEAQAGKVTPMLFDFFAIIDTAQNGELSAEELEEAYDIIRIAKKAKMDNSPELNYKHLPEAVTNVLTHWDHDKSGSVSIAELMMAADAQKKLREEHRLMKKFLVGAIITILVLMAGTFALSFAAVEVAKETKADQTSGIVTTVSGTPAAIGMAVQHIQIVDFPTLGTAKLKEMRDFSYMHNGVHHHRMLSGFDWHSEKKMDLLASNGEVLNIDNEVLTLRKPDGQVLALDPEAGRRLNMCSGALLTSGSFTMMASAGY